MPLLFAIPFAVLLIVVATALAQPLQAPVLPTFVVIGTAIWVYFDAKKHDLERYRTGLIAPEVVAIGCILLYIVAFPWYLSTRHKIRNGQMPLKNPNDGEGPRPLP